MDGKGTSYLMKGIVQRLPFLGTLANMKIGKTRNPKPTCRVVMGWMSFDDGKLTFKLQGHQGKYHKI